MSLCENGYVTIDSRRIKPPPPFPQKEPNVRVEEVQLGRGLAYQWSAITPLISDFLKLNVI